MTPALEGMGDTELLAAHVGGHPEAFAVLIGRHQDRLWAVALRTLRNPHDAADALQDAYVCAFRRAHTFRGDARVSTWLHRIVINSCLDRIRYLARRRTDPLDDELAGLTGPDDDGLTDVVADALAQISPDQRAALVLVDMEGFSIEEAAEMLGCPPGTVKSRCSRGRARLAPVLRELLASR
ncbi:RNA polymerase sigma-70 factor, ECF subfamily [Raineyella antarctica]|uniref:RNA polymerase sigma-70 factor, ECF subfamily n=1 Tax=Raineyella antarctica TaxID=1577474 RepID=A0A1G6HTL1_9ACTN|nr:RNA polymerase sigma factor SigM [Raineyella antarctica]SDB97175.1 RNA polymerase sigma-70 factor, ECF subfamily [Raineyella antarctica]